MSIKLASPTERKEKLVKELDIIVKKIKQMGAEKIILFGSLAKGGITANSDIDLIVVKNTKERFLDRLEALYKECAPPVAVDILCYTPEEFKDMCKWSSFIKRVIEEGRVLYET